MHFLPGPTLSNNSTGRKPRYVDFYSLTSSTAMIEISEFVTGYTFLQFKEVKIKKKDRALLESYFKNYPIMTRKHHQNLDVYVLS